MKPEFSLDTAMTFAYGTPNPVSPGIVRLVARNPGPLTFHGTNTYLIGTTELAVVDPGPDDAAHRAAILETARGRPITDIFVTHAHRDHVGGAARLKAETGARVLAHGRVEPAPAGEPAATPRAQAFDDQFEPDVRLGHGDVAEGREWRLEAVHTPGHAPDHVCLALLGRSVLFSGDHVMAWNTTLVAPPEGSMASYMASLELLLPRREQLYLPGHGGRIREPVRTVKAYLLHRRLREEAVLAAIRSGISLVPAIVARVYPLIDEGLARSAALSVLAHVEHLIARGLVTCDGPPSDRPLCPA